MDKQTKKKEPLICYFHFMYNVWNEEWARKLFNAAPCGWEHVWNKWRAFCCHYGMNAAITMFYVDGIDESLRSIIAEAANEYYSG